MSVFYDLSKTPRNILNQAIVRAIVSENNGAWFDPSDLSTLYQDAAGTIPVIAVEQPVGLMLDKSRGLMLGPELVSNGTFDSSEGWTIANSDATHVATFSDGTLRYLSDTTTPQLLVRSNYTISAGKTYAVTVSVSNYVSGQLRVEIGGVAQAIPIGAGIKTFYVLSVTSNSVLTITRQTSGVDITLDNISVKELYGNHATQSITASRPTLSARKNILLATEALATQSVTTLAATYTLSFTGTGSVTLSGTSTGTLTGNGTDGVSLTFTPTAGTLTLMVSGSVTKAQLELSAVAGPYQRVTTATNYDTDERYFKKFLRFDGVDDYLVLPYMGLYAAGSASVVAGVYGHQFGKTRNGRVICESLVSSSLPTYTPCVDRFNIKTMYIYMTNNTGASFASIDMSLPQDSTNIMSVIDSGNSVKSYQNAGQKVTSSYLRSGSVTLDSTTIGKGLNNGSGEIWMGDLYSLIITKSALSDAQRIKCERYTASKAGVTL